MASPTPPKMMPRVTMMINVRSANSSRTMPTVSRVSILSLSLLLFSLPLPKLFKISFLPYRGAKRGAELVFFRSLVLLYHFFVHISIKMHDFFRRNEILCARTLLCACAGARITQAEKSPAPSAQGFFCRFCPVITYLPFRCSRNTSCAVPRRPPRADGRLPARASR